MNMFNIKKSKIRLRAHAGRALEFFYRKHDRYVKIKKEKEWKQIPHTRILIP